jgi:hypothetical protein
MKWDMSEEGGLGALLGAYNSDSDSQDQKSTGNELLILTFKRQFYIIPTNLVNEMSSFIE